MVWFLENFRFPIILRFLWDFLPEPLLRLRFAMATPARNYVFTVFVEEENGHDDAFAAAESSATGPIRYVCWQLERAPDTGRLHLQGYVEFFKPQRLRAAQQALRAPTAHLEKRRGTRDQARDYCRKEESRVQGPWEAGKWIGGQGML